MRDWLTDSAVAPAYTDNHTLQRLAWVRRTLQIALDVSTESADLLAASLLTSIHSCSLFRWVSSTVCVHGAHFRVWLLTGTLESILMPMSMIKE